VTVTKELLDESAKGLEGKELTGDCLEFISSSMEHPWYVWDRDTYKGASCHIPFYTVSGWPTSLTNSSGPLSRKKDIQLGKLGNSLSP